MRPLPDFAALLDNADLPCNPVQLDQLAQYLKLAWQYDPALGLTGFSGADEFVRELVLESLRLLELGPIPAQATVADLGSGNGSPVVPLAVCAPESRCIAVESISRRCTFLKTVTVTLKLGNLEVLNSRAEDLAQTGRRFDLVISRAFAKPQKFMETALALGADGAEVRGYCGAACGEVTQAASALGLSGVNFVEYAAKTSRRHVWSVRL